MAKGNNQEKWNRFLAVLDEKLLLGLLDKVRKTNSYHFEEDILFLEAATKEDYEYLNKDSVLQQIQLLAQDATGIKTVRITIDPSQQN